LRHDNIISFIFFLLELKNSCFVHGSKEVTAFQKRIASYANVKFSIQEMIIPVGDSESNDGLSLMPFDVIIIGMTEAINTVGKYDVLMD